MTRFSGGHTHLDLSRSVDVGDISGDAGGPRDIVEGQLGDERVLCRGTCRGGKKKTRVSTRRRFRSRASCKGGSHREKKKKSPLRLGGSTYNPIGVIKKKKKTTQTTHHLHEEAAGLADATGGAEDGNLVATGLGHRLGDGAGGGGSGEHGYVVDRLEGKGGVRKGMNVIT